MKVKYLAALSFSIAIYTVKAQELPLFKGLQQQLSASPTASALGTYGGIELKKSTGGIAKSIPLFQLKQGAISYNPTIEYYSTGVRVNDWGGRLGIGWNENFTAVIHRTIRSVPDEYATQRLTTPVYQLVQNPTSANYQTVSTIEAHGNLINGVGSFDGEYDLFSYNIFGISGQFIIVNNQAVLLNHQEKIKIDVLSTTPTHTFRITDNRGFKYYFQTEIEYTCMGIDEYVTTSLPTAWFLNKIESPYNDELNFNYMSVSYACKTNFIQNFSFKDGEEIGDDYDYCIDDLYHTYGNSYEVSRRYTQTKCLTSVIGADIKLTFGYISRADLVGDKLLSTITLYDGQDNVVSNVDFDYYTYTATTQPEGVLYEGDDLYSWNFGDIKTRYFLKNVTFPVAGSKDKEYSFSYVNPQNLPHRFSFSQDEGGYYNGVSNTWFIPQARVEEYVAQHPTLWNFPYSFTGNREPNYNASKAGILYQITYPTGGTDEIGYSPNTYIDSENEESYFPGLRVSQVISNSVTSPTSTKTYHYYNFTKQGNQIVVGDVISSNTVDRGNAFVKSVSTRRFISVECEGGGGGWEGSISTCVNITYHTFSSNSRFDLNAFQGNPIAYACVTEEQGNAFMASMFDVSVDMLGWVAYGDESFLNPKENTAWKNGLEVYRYYGTKNGYSNYILKEQTWDYENTNTLITENCCVFKKYEGTGYCGGLLTYEPYTIISYNLWNNWYKLSSFSETLYDENSQNPVASTTNYYYDNVAHTLLTREETTDSKGNAIKKINKYPLDINTGNYASMVSLFMHNYPVEQISLINNQVINSSLVTYKSGGGSYVPDKVYSLETTSPLSSFTYFNGTTKDSHYNTTPEIDFNTYDSKGNILQKTGKEGIVTSYLWDSNGSFPMAKVVNATYSQISSQDGKICTYNSETLYNSLNSLVPGAVTTTYSYKPIVGMSSQTDPNGTTTYYEYDSFNRLRLIKDEDGNIVKRYSYNYADL
ncbi:MAG: hypothetical protein A2W90_16375 [Bacteroidetes bacterium GWF2_42_66]|nr:MAG: hypothetical protein A2W92_22490 [Bacteroidetes bacterium GWA2_42_15]OFX96271.1 MAG: hypothetical protein A2W89_05305 [Bacteroidetes bacterium GWE2_42_39]OFY46310.1 MAG: hypothetical protein A2W90_16375 [Bacteroidetes bacterium GWF2_42_66]HBL78307.1 hypothetical protein [Prolixibacteraceae bacterium]HCU60087.1 hypothetical protein [Prolixibacteraceae bacterium]